MKPTYEVINIDFDNKVIKRIDQDGRETWFPTDPANSDYQAYLADEAKTI
jgi:hypothetical protein